MLAVPRKLRLGERAGHDAAKFSDVAHMDGAPVWVNGQRPAQGTVRLLLRSHYAHQILVVERRDHERVVGKSGVSHGALDFRLVGEMRNIDCAATDLLHIWKRRPDEV